MNKTLILGVILIIIVAAMPFVLEQNGTSQANQKEVIKILVDQAADEIGAKGEAVFPQFNTPYWYYDDIYVFVWRMDGIRVVYPPDPSDVGTNQIGLKDANGKPIGELFIQVAERGGGWVEYQWPKPNSTVPSKKLAYIKPASYQNQSFLVGSGIYI